MKPFGLLTSLLLLLALTSPLTMAQPTETSDSRLQQRLAQAQADRAAGRYYNALEGFRQVLVMNPNLTRARLELALTYYALLDTDNARIQARHVLADNSLTEGVRAAVNKLLAAIDTLEQELRPGASWKRELALRAGSDDNVNFGPSNELIDIGGDLYRIAPDFLPHEDTFYALIGRLTHRYQLPGRHRIGQRAASPHWETQLTLYHKDYAQEDDFELSFASLSTGYGLTAPKAWRATLLLRTDHILFGGDSYLTQFSLLPSLQWQLETGELQWDNTLMRREYSDSANSPRDSDYYASGLAWSDEFRDGTLSLRLGGKGFAERTQDPYYNNDGYELSLAASQELSPQLAAYGKYAHREVSFEGVSPLFNTNREETRRRASLGLLYKFSGGSLQGATLRLDHTRTERDSTISLYEYDRNVTSLMLEYAY